MKIQYRKKTVNIHFDSDLWAWVASGDVNQTLQAETDDGAVIEVKAIINSIQGAV